MDASLKPESNCFFEAIGNAYLAHGGEAWRIRYLERWQPKRTLWSTLQSGIGRLPGVRSREARIGKHRMRYLDTGRRDRPAVVLLHGFGASKENWLNLSFSLRRHYRLLIPDLPGFGQSSFCIDEDYSADSQAERLVAWLDQAGVERAHWVGNSLGGGVAAAVADRFAERVDSLTLMNAAGVAGARRSAFERGLIEGRNRLVPTHKRAVRELFLMVTERNKELSAALLTPFIAGDMMHRAPVNRRIFLDNLRSGRSLVERLPTMQMPVLVIWGTHDRVLDPSCVEVFLSRLPRATAVVLPGVGHVPMLEVPKTTARALRSFWRGLERQASPSEAPQQAADTTSERAEAPAV